MSAQSSIQNSLSSETVIVTRRDANVRFNYKCSLYNNRKLFVYYKDSEGS